MSADWAFLGSLPKSTRAGTMVSPARTDAVVRKAAENVGGGVDVALWTEDALSENSLAVVVQHDSLHTLNGG